jgi:hypothetical protein
MGLLVTKKIMGRDHDLYLKIDALQGHKKYVEVIAGFYWDRDVSSEIQNRIETLAVPTKFDRNSEGNPFAIAYEAVKAELDNMGVAYSDVDPVDEEDVSTIAAVQDDSVTVAKA